MVFRDRTEAGLLLGDKLRHSTVVKDARELVVVGLPRGGVPVAFEVARALHAPLDVIVVRKLGVPYQHELGMGAIGEDGVRVINQEIVRGAAVTEDELAKIETAERVQLERRARRYRASRPRLSLAGRDVVIVDDGIATGSTARAACNVARAEGARRVIVAAPIAPEDWVERLGVDADEYVAVLTPKTFHGIGEFYRDFRQTSDDEVVACLERAAAPGPPLAAGGRGYDGDVSIACGPVHLPGRLTLPARAIGLVVFVHGSGSSRHSPRNRYVASVLHDARIGTLLFDLLTPGEEADRGNVFDIELLAARLTEVTKWLAAKAETRGLSIGYFGASTGAAAALWAAADLADSETPIAAVVSRGGRPDLAAPVLATVKAPTLLIVGGDDTAVLVLNRRAEQMLRCENQLVIIPGATHLFVEPGTLAAVAHAAADWFTARLHSMKPASTVAP